MPNHHCDCMAQGPALLPVRYAVVPDSITGTLPEWATPLTEDYPKQKGYHYGLRALRRGFIYIYYPYLSSWEAWSVCDDGSLWKQLSAENVHSKSKPDCLQGSYTQGGKDFISLPVEVLKNDIWIAFTQCKWTTATLDRYMQNGSDRQERMQCLSSSQWERPGAGIAEALEEHLSSVLDYVPMQENALSPPQMLPYEGPVSPVSYSNKNAYHLCDETQPQWQRWIASLWGEEKKSGCAIQPQWTLYPWCMKREARKTAQQMKLRGIKPDGTPVKPLMIALHDATGITHELTGWANGILALQQKFSDERKVEFSTLNLINGVKQLLINSKFPQFSEKLEKTPLNQEALDYAYRKYLDAARESAIDERDIISRGEYEARVIRSRKNKMEYEFAGEELEKYTRMLNQERLDSFSECIDILTTRVINLMEWLIDYRIKWLQHLHFIAATQDFYSGENEDNLSYREIVAFAISGINTHTTGQELLDKWIAEYSTANKENLVWRTHFYNNPDIMNEAESLLSNIRDADTNVVSQDQVFLFFEANAAKLIKIFKGFEKATDALKNKLPGDAVLSQKVLYSMDQYMATVGARIFSATGIGRILDSMRGVMTYTIFSLSAGKSVAQTKAFSSQYFGWMYERHTYIAGSVFYNPDKAITQSNLKLASSRFAKLNNAFAEYGKGEAGSAVFQATSIRILVTFLNVAELCNQYSHSKGDATSKAKIASAALATASGITDIAMPAMEKAWEGKNGLQYLKMAGAGCSMIAAGITLGLDIGSISKELEGKNRVVFLGLYAVKTLTDVAALIKANGKLMEALIVRFGWETVEKGGRSIWLGKLAKPAFSRLGIEWIGLLASWEVSLLIMLADYTAKEYYSRDELQKWFEMGIFGEKNTLNTDGIKPDKASAEIAGCRESLLNALHKMAEPAEKEEQDKRIHSPLFPIFIEADAPKPEIT